MVRYLLKRLGRGILTILLSVTLVFFIVRAMPSNPVDLMVSPQMSEEAQQALIEEFGLDQSKLTQYGLYMKELLHGNLGSSFAKRIPVSQYIAEKLPWTLLLLAAVMLIVIHADRHSDWYQRGLVRGSPQRKTFGPGHQRTGDDGNICVHSIYGVPTVVHFFL